jgi:hypothetical protein
VGVNVYAVVAILFKAGDQLPVIPLFEVSGRGFIVSPTQIDVILSKDGITSGFIVTVKDIILAHCPTSGVKV